MEMDHDYETGEETRVGRGFIDKFKSFQNILNVKNYNSPSTTSNERVSTYDYEERTRKTFNSRKRITPITKEKKTESVRCSDVLSDKVKDRMRHIIDILCESRSWISREEVYRFSLEFIEKLNVVFPKSKDKISLTCMVCIILGSRIRGLYFDLHIVAIQVGESMKDVQKTMYETLPSLTSTSEYDRKVLNSLIDPKRTSLLLEYETIMKELVRGFSENAELTEYDIEYYRNICEKIFSNLEGDNDCDYEKQFCVTPDKVLVYGIFEIIRRKVTGVTERSICEYLSEKFKIPRVTVEKMKRLVVKYIRPNTTL